MAYTSFRVRRQDLVAAPDTNPFGSYTRGTDTTAPTGLTRTTSDSALRADGFIAATGELIVDATFSATAVDYSTINLTWSQFGMSNPADNGSGDSSIYEIVVVYGKNGAPETVADGIVIKTQRYDDDVWATSHHDLPDGRWAYYSLFLHWNQNGTGASGVSWYERVATLQELVPYNHGSTDKIWKRIPEYLRVADTSGADLDPYNQGQGQFRRFISIFGFEMDRTQTLIDAVMTGYDPSITESESIAHLTAMLGLEITPQEIGTSRIRQIIQDIGYYRLRKGTIDAAAQYITAVSGCQVDVIENTEDPRYTFRVYAEKVNLVADSEFKVTSGTKKWALSLSNSFTRTNLVKNPNFETNSTGWTNNGALVTVSRSTTNGANLGTGSLKVVRASNGTGSEVTQGAWNGSSTANMIPVTPGDYYYLSVYVRYISGVTPNVQHGVKYYTSAGVYISETNSVPSILSSTTTWSRKGRSLVAPTNAAFASIQVNEIVPVGAAASTWQVDSVLLEKVSSVSDFWPYFDGTYVNTWSGYTLLSNTWNGTANASTSTTTWSNNALYYTQTDEYITITNNDSASAQFALTSLVAVPVDADTEYWSSIEMTGNAALYGSQWSASAGWTEWATTNQYERVMPLELSPTGRRVILMPDITTSTTAYPVLQFAIPAAGTATINRWMVEPKTYGTFFNGDSDFGGFVYQNNFADYAWDGSQYASYSTYTTNKQKTKNAINKLLPTLIPVTVLIKGLTGYEVVYDWIPGKE